MSEQDTICAVSTPPGAGGIGIIHRFMTAERQAEEVRRAKRAESHIVESPMTVPCGATAAGLPVGL